MVPNPFSRSASATAPSAPFPHLALPARAVQLTLTFGALAVLLFGVFAYSIIVRYATYGREALQAEKTIQEVNDLGGTMSRAQMSVRQYVLSGRESDLETWEDHGGRLPGMVFEMERAGIIVAADTAAQRIDEQLSMHRKAVAKRMEGDVEAATALLTSVDAERVRIGVSAAIEGLRMRHEGRLKLKEAESPAPYAQSLIVAATLFVFTVFLAGAAFIRHNNRKWRQAHARIDYLEALRQSVAANMADGVVTTTPDGTILDVNEAAAVLLGYGEEEALGQNIGRMIAPTRDGVEYTAFLADALRASAVLRRTGIEATAVKKDGLAIPVQISVSDVPGEGTRLVSTLIHDMTAIKKAEAALRARERQLRQITDTLPVLIAEFDADERVRFHNRAFREYMGGPFDRIQGAHVREVLGEERYAFIKPHLDRALAGQELTCERVVPRPEGGQKEFQLHLLPRIPQGAGEVSGCYVFGTDVTVLKRIDRMKTEFVSTVSHELRTPLTSIRGSLGLVAAGTAGQLPDMAANLIGIAKNNCERLVRLINDILDVEKIESGKVTLRMARQEVGALVRQAVTANEGFAREHKVGFALQADVPLEADVDSDKLLQVLTNLLSNAAKFSPEGGVVAVRVTGRDDRVRVEVTDRGPGIPLEFQDRIFQKFSQADSSAARSKGGSGLGLNIARALVMKMNGELGFHSVPGQGATFYFELPQWRDPETAGGGAQALPPQAAPESGGDRGPEAREDGLPCVLHVEDDSDMRQLVAALVRECATCVSANSLATARARLRERKVDLVLLDIKLGEESGWDLMPQLRETHPDVPVIVFSAMEASEEEGRHVQAALVKSFTSEADLLRQVKHYLCAPERPPQLTFTS